MLDLHSLLFVVWILWQALFFFFKDPVMVNFMCQLDWTLDTRTFGQTFFWVCLWWGRAASILFSSHVRRPPSEPCSELAVLLK